uniref:Uncharacterized protein n=1 Tax=Lutzomyia longipalpis TaxID=7200 RepID=A0A1B0CPV0_LUTLO
MAPHAESGGCLSPPAETLLLFPSGNERRDITGKTMRRVAGSKESNLDRLIGIANFALPPNDVGVFDCVVSHGVGPGFWGLINPQWNMCNKGRRQSPINVEPDKLLFDPYLRPLHIDKHKRDIDEWSAFEFCGIPPA